MYETEIKWEAWNLVPEGIDAAGGRTPKAFNVDMYKFVVDGRMKEREGWQDRAQTCWSEHFHFLCFLRLVVPYSSFSYSATLTILVS